jgi:putative sterol carrier protein
MAVAETFETMRSRFNPAGAAGVNKTLQWNISGDDAGIWAFRIQNQSCELIPGGVEKPDITFHVKDKDWLALNEGKMDPAMAFMSGKMKIAGDLGLAMKMRAFFPMRQHAG